MSQRTRTLTFVYRRKRRGRGLRKNKDMYQVWVLTEVITEEEARYLPESALKRGTIESLCEHLKEALAKSMADRVQQMVWKSADNLSEQQAADLIANLPDMAKMPVETLTDKLATAARVPAPVAELGSDTIATFVMRPVLEPAERALHGLEVIGIVVGLVTGLHPLAMLCVKYLAHDEFGSVLASGFERLLASPGVREVLPTQQIIGDQKGGEPSRKLIEPVSGRETIGPVSARAGGGGTVMEGQGAVAQEVAGKILKVCATADGEIASTSDAESLASPRLSEIQDGLSSI